MNIKTTQPIARKFADLFDNDGTEFRAKDGREFDEVVHDMGAEVIYGKINWEDPCHQSDDNSDCVYDIVSAHEYTDDGPIRYVFPDGSAVVVSGEGWDIEGKNPFSWEGA